MLESGIKSCELLASEGGGHGLLVNRDVPERGGYFVCVSG